MDRQSWLPENAGMVREERSAQMDQQWSATCGIPISDCSGWPKPTPGTRGGIGHHEEELPPNDPDPDENPLDRGAGSDGARADEPELDDEAPPKLLPVPLPVGAELPETELPVLEELPVLDLPVDSETRGGEAPVDPNSPSGTGALLSEFPLADADEPDTRGGELPDDDEPGSPADDGALPLEPEVDPPEPDTRGGALPVADDPVPTLGGAGATALLAPTRGGAPAAPKLPVPSGTAARASPLETGPSDGMEPWFRAVTANPAPVSPARPPPLLVTSVVRCESGAGAVLTFPPLTRTGGGGASRFTTTGWSITTERGGS